MKGTQVLRNFEGIAIVHSVLRKAHAGFGPWGNICSTLIELDRAIRAFGDFYTH